MALKSAFYSSDIKSFVSRTVREHRKFYLLQGVVFIVLGMAAMLAPVIATEVTAVTIGFLLFMAGLVQAGVSYGGRTHWAALVSAMLTIVIGFLMMVWPETGMIALATLAAIFLLLEGVFELFFAGLFAPFKGWKWMLLSGFASLALSIIVFAGWPTTALWFLGILIGINFATFGFSLLMLVKHSNANET